MALEIDLGPDSYIDADESYEENYRKGPGGAFAPGTPIIEISGEPQYTFMGQPVHFPHGIGAGTILSSEYAIAAFKHGYSVTELKTVRNNAYECAKNPNVTPVDLEGRLTPEIAQKGVYAAPRFGREVNGSNSYLVPSPPSETWQPDMERAVRYASTKSGLLVVASWQGTVGTEKGLNYDIEECGRKVRDTEVKAGQLNTSCPNEGSDHPLLCNDLEGSEQAVLAARRGFGYDRALSVKIAKMDRQFLEKWMLQVARHANAVTAINTVGGKVLNQSGEQFFPGKGRDVSGFSGDCIRPDSLEMAEWMLDIIDRHQADLGHLEVIASGGITGPEHFRMFQKLGVKSGLSVLGTLHDPYLGEKILQDQGVQTTRVAGTK